MFSCNKCSESKLPIIQLSKPHFIKHFLHQQHLIYKTYILQINFSSLLFCVQLILDVLDLCCFLVSPVCLVFLFPVIFLSFFFFQAPPPHSCSTSGIILFSRGPSRWTSLRQHLLYFPVHLILFECQILVCYRLKGSSQNSCNKIHHHTVQFILTCFLQNKLIFLKTKYKCDC